MVLVFTSTGPATAPAMATAPATAATAAAVAAAGVTACCCVPVSFFCCLFAWGHGGFSKGVVLDLEVLLLVVLMPLLPPLPLPFLLSLLAL